ncbi:MAG TPA: hypothetical protein PKD00_06775 [Burkholderiales bacterium]|nr:hypothetical protein [Burkholderiales bacterium]
MFKNYYFIIFIFILLIISSCTNSKINNSQNAQISLAYPGNFLGISASTLDLKSLFKKNQEPLSHINTYYIPIFNNSSIPVSVINATLESNINVWAVAISDKCINGISLDSCNLILAFNSNAVNNLSQLSSIITIKFSNGITNKIPITGQIITNDGVIMQAPKEIMINSSGNAYGVITAFNNTNSPVLISESEITTNNNEKWVFTVNCDGNNSKIINASSTCSIGFVSSGKLSIPTTVQVSIPISNSISYDNTQIINVNTILIPFQTSPYLAYLGSTVSLNNSTSASFSLLNLGEGNLSGIVINGLPNNIIQSNNCSNIPQNGLCTVTLNVLRGSAPPLTVLNIYATNESNKNIQQVYVTGQTLSVLPLLINFGTQFNGTIVQKDVTISNLGPNPLNYQIGTISNTTFTLAPGNCTSNTLVGFGSCVFHINYTAPPTSQQDTSSLIISSNTFGETVQTINITANSIFSSAWSNIITSGGYTDNGTAISALIAGIDGSIVLALGNFANHVWQLASDGITWENISGNFTNYYNQTITAFGISFSNFFVAGYIDGVVAVCGMYYPTCSSTICCN